MKKSLKYISMILLAALLVLHLPIDSVYAQSTANVSISSGSSEVGNEVSITVTISSDAEIGGANIFLSYDSGMVEAVSGFDSGGGGTIQWVDTDTYKSKKRTITFKVLKAGTSTISVTGASRVASMEGDYMTLATSSGSITGNAPVTYSTDNTLASLSISPGVLSPAFSPNITQYTTSVSADCDKLVVSAQANDSKATVKVSGTRMDPGANTTTITVTAESGAKRVYTIRTTKETAQTEPQPTAPGEQPTEEVQPEVTVGGSNYKISSDFEAHPLPAGYEVSDYEYNGTAVQAGKGVNTKLLLMYLESADGNGTSGFYVYDSVSKTFTLYNEVSQPDITYVILPITDAMEKPEGFTLSEYTINEKKVTVLMSTDNTFCLFYGVDSLGATGWYRYDLKDKTIQAYSEKNVSAADTTSDKAVDANTQAKQQDGQKLWQIITLILSLVAVAAVIAAVVFAAKFVRTRQTLLHTIQGDSPDYNDVYGDYDDSDDDVLEDDYEDEADEDIQELSAAEEEMKPTENKMTEEKTDYETLDILDIDEDK